MILKRWHIYFLSLIIYAFDFATLLPFSIPALGSLSLGKILMIVSLMIEIGQFILIRHGRFSIVGVKILSPILFILWFVFLSVFWSLEIGSALRYLFIYLFNFIALFISFITIRQAGLSSFWNLVRSIAWISVIFAIFDWAYGIRPIISRQYSFANSVVGIYPNSITLGFVLSAFVPATLMFFINGSIIRIRDLILTLAIILLLPSIGSRTALIACLITILATYVVQIRRISFTYILAAALTVIGALNFNIFLSVAPIPYAVVEKLQTIPAILSGDDVLTQSARALAIESGLEKLSERPLIGYGAGAVEIIYSDIPELLAEGNVNAHNWWMECLINGGIILFSAFLYLYTFILINILRLARASNHRGVIFSVAFTLAFPLLSFGPGSLINVPFTWIVIGGVLGIIYLSRLQNMPKGNI